MPFEKGQSGCPGGRRKEKPFRDALMLVLNEGEDVAPDGPRARNKIRAVASQLVAKAMDGDVGAIKEIGDRVDGKVAQQQIITGDEDGGPVQTETRSFIVNHPDAPKVVTGAS